MSSASFSQLAEFLQTRSGLVLTPDKMYLVETRLGPLMKREGLPDLSALVGRVKAALAGPIANEVVELMTTNETLFFRDGKPFEHLKEKVWPRSAPRAAPQARSASGRPPAAPARRPIRWPCRPSTTPPP